MAKNKNITVCLLWLLVSLCTYSQNSVRQRVIDTALSQVGVREATGKNDGAQVEKYLRVTKLGPGFAWCAAFPSWCFEVNGVKALKSAWAPNWFPRDKTILKARIVYQTPQPADVFGLFINNRIGHVGYIYKWDVKVVTTIEGNTNHAGSREGDGVYIKKRLRRQIYAVSSWIK